MVCSGTWCIGPATSPGSSGLALAIAGIGYVVYNLRPYLYPDAEIGFVFAAFLGELVFLVWLAIWGWRIPEPIA